MKLGELLQQYMSSQRLSYREFAKKCDLSAGYISMLVNDRNPKTGKPPVPAITTYDAIAKGMGMTLDELFARIDDAPVALQPHQPDDLTDEEYYEWREEMRRNPEKRTMFSLTRDVSRAQLRQINAFIQGLRASNDHDDEE